MRCRTVHGIVERRVVDADRTHSGLDQISSLTPFTPKPCTPVTASGEKTHWTAAALFHVIKTDVQTRSEHEQIVRVPIGYYYYYYLLLLLSFDLRAYN